MRKQYDGPKADFQAWRDFIPAGEEDKYPGMGNGLSGIDYQPASINATDGVPLDKGRKKKLG